MKKLIIISLFLAFFGISCNTQKAACTSDKNTSCCAKKSQPSTPACCLKPAKKSGCFK